MNERNLRKQDAGKRNPGKQSPGKQSPGKQSPGKQSPGRQSPGKQSPGKQSPGKQSPEMRTLERQNTKKQNAGRQSSGRQTPERQNSERQNSENRIPGEENTENMVPEQDPVKLYALHRTLHQTGTDRNAPIGVFDSGVGGLTVMREIMRQMPDERIVYFGDTARVPYGSKSRETIIRYSRQNIRFLRTRGVKAIVIACNTASSHALETVAGENDIPVIGVVYAGAKTAAAVTKNGRIGIIGTLGTVSSRIYPQVIDKMNPEIRVFQEACPLLVPLVEEGLLEDPVTKEMIKRYLSVLKEKKVDTLVLGCTHYPLLSAGIGRMMGEKVTLVNPAYETAVELKGLLNNAGLLNDEKKKRKTEEKYEFYVSDLAEKFTDFARFIFSDEVKTTKKIEIEEY